MGIGHLGLRKLLKEETNYRCKNTHKHKCSFTEHYLLKVTDKVGLTNYYNIMKCSECLSFKSIPEEGNIQGHVLHELSEEQKKLPVIIGSCKHYYSVQFAKLENVTLKENS